MDYIRIMINLTYLSLLIFLYLAFSFFIYFASDNVLFPVPESSYQDGKFPGEIKISTENGQIISALYIKNTQATYTILFSHGNAEDLGMLWPFLETLSAHGFSVLAYDYQGYGTSGGRPSEKNTYLDIQAAYDYLLKNLEVSPSHIILYGRSLGTGPTVELAKKTKIAGVILESPMLTAYRVVTILPLLPLDKYKNNEKIGEIKVPILFIHGTEDHVIPFWHSQKLYQLATTSKKYFFPVEKADHNDLINLAGEKYWQTITNFANSLSHP